MREISPRPGLFPGIWLAHVVSRQQRGSTYETKMRLTPGLVCLVTGLVMWFVEHGIRVSDGHSRFYPVHVSRRATPRQVSSLSVPR